MQAYQANQQSDCMEEAARIMAKAFTNCMTDRYHPALGVLSPNTDKIAEPPLTLNHENGGFTILLALS